MPSYHIDHATHARGSTWPQRRAVGVQKCACNIACRTFRGLNSPAAICFSRPGNCCLAYSKIWHAYLQHTTANQFITSRVVPAGSLCTWQQFYLSAIPVDEPTSRKALSAHAQHQRQGLAVMLCAHQVNNQERATSHMRARCPTIKAAAFLVYTQPQPTYSNTPARTTGFLQVSSLLT